MEMLTKYMKTTSGRHLAIFDNVFEISQLRVFKTFAERSFFKLGSTTSDHFENANKFETFFQCYFSREDLDNFGIMPLLQDKFPKYFVNKEYTSTWINATFSGNTIRVHTDTDKLVYKKSTKLEDCDLITILFYVNLRWDMEDGGETIFCDDKGEPEIAVAYKPNRVVFFDSYIPHKLAFTRPSLNDPRFSFTSGLQKMGICE